MYIYLKHSGVFGFPMIATGIFNDFVVGNKGGSVIEPRTSLSFSFPSIQERLWRQRKKDVHRFGVFARMKLHHFAHWKIIWGEICSRVFDPGEFFSLTSKYFPSQTHSSERSPVYQFPFNFSALFFSLEITTRIPSKISLNIFPFFKFLQQLQPFC